MPNPFYVDPAVGYDPSALQGFNQALMGLGQVNREKREKEAAIAQQAEMQAGMEAAIQSGDPSQIAAFMRANPDQADIIKQSIAQEGEMVQQDATNFLSDILTTPEDQWMPKLKQRVEAVEARGGDPKHSVKLIESFGNNPQQAKKDAEVLLATVGTPGAYDAYKESTAVEGPDYSPLQEKIAAEGIDPNSQEGYKRARELNQRAATDPSLAPSDQSILKDANDAQLLSAGFASRVDASNQRLSELEATEGFDPSSPGQIMAREVPGGNFVISPKHQDYFQAKDDFITAVLRKESGAVISDQEYVREDKKYFPQPGDGQSVIKQKAKARERAFQNLRNASKGVYDVQKRNPNLYGGDAEDVDSQALEWARSNPSDPRAARILELQGQ